MDIKLIKFLYSRFRDKAELNFELVIEDVKRLMFETS